MADRWDAERSGGCLTLSTERIYLGVCPIVRTNLDPCPGPCWHNRDFVCHPVHVPAGRQCRREEYLRSVRTEPIADLVKVLDAAYPVLELFHREDFGPVEYDALSNLNEATFRAAYFNEDY